MCPLFRRFPSPTFCSAPVLPCPHSSSKKQSAWRTLFLLVLPHNLYLLVIFPIKLLLKFFLSQKTILDWYSKASYFSWPLSIPGGVTTSSPIMLHAYSLSSHSQNLLATTEFREADVPLLWFYILLFLSWSLWSQGLHLFSSLCCLIQPTITISTHTAPDCFLIIWNNGLIRVVDVEHLAFTLHEFYTDADWGE